MTDHWIIEAQGHRILEREAGPPDGAMIDTVFGPANVIRIDQLAPSDEWICDNCNGDIYIGGDRGSWPVAVVSGWALCMDCTERIGTWPTRRCGCEACVFEWAVWEVELVFNTRRVS